MGAKVLQGDETHHDQERAAEHLAATLDRRRNRPPDQDDERRPQAEQDRVAGGEAGRDTKRAPAPEAGGTIAIAVNRQRGDRHQMIGAKTMQEAQTEGRYQEKQAL